MNLKQWAKQLKSNIPAMFLTLKDKQTPIIAKLFAAITVGYELSPIDLIPDFIPVLGYLDDLIILPVLISITIHFVPKEVWEKNCTLAEHMWETGKPKKWRYAIPIVIIWLLIILLIIKAIWF